MSQTLIIRPGDVGPGGETDEEQQGLIQIVRLPVSNFMPPEGQEFRRAAYVPIPAVGAQAVVAQLTVPDGYNGMINALANVFVGGGFTEGQGGIVWQLFQDFNPGVIAPDFDNIVASLGAVSNPAKLNGIRIKERQLVTLLVKNVSVVVAGQFIGGLIGGYYYPIDLEPSMAF